MTLFVFATKSLLATHIVGGELYYTKTSGDYYDLTLKLYFDCYNGSDQAIGADSTASTLFIREVNSGNFIQTLESSLYSASFVNFAYANPCLQAPGDVCVREAVYKYTTSLPPIDGGYEIIYQRCCRNSTILNISSPGDVGTTLNLFIPGSDVVETNSSPRYNLVPPSYTCVNVPLVFDHSATDPDGDQIVYEFCSAFDGASSSGPKPSISDALSSYGNVPYSGAYSGANPIDGSPQFTIDPATGILTGTPTKTGQFVIAICAYEYRNGVLLSVNKRDYQFNVLNCGSPIAAFPTQTNLCDGMTFNFQNNSFNATTFNWTFGDNSSSTIANPTHTYVDTGAYPVTLIVTNNLAGCADTITKTVHAYPKLAPTFSASGSQCLDLNSFNFSAGGIYDPSATFSWNFGNATPANANGVSLNSVNNVSFTSSGTQTVSVTVSQFVCTKTLSSTINILPEPRPTFITPELQCIGSDIPIQIVSSGNSNITDTTWLLPPEATLTNSNLLSATIHFSDTGKFEVGIIASNSFGCVDTTKVNLFAYPKFAPTFNIPAPQCILGNSFNFSASGLFTPNATFSWNFGINATPINMQGAVANNISFDTAGDYPIVLTGYQYQCEQKDTQFIHVVQMPVASISGQNQFCEGTTYYFTEESFPCTSVSWNFGDPATNSDTSTAFAPNYTYPDTGKYMVTLTAGNEGLCYKTIQQQFNIQPLVRPHFNKPVDNCISNAIYSFSAGGIYGSDATFTWDFSEGGTPASSNQITVNPVTYIHEGNFPVSLFISEFGCLKEYKDTVRIFPEPIPYFNKSDSGCTPITVRFADSSFSATPKTYTWSFGDGNYSTDSVATHTYTKGGLYDVTLTINTNSGCIATRTFTIKNAIDAWVLPVAGLKTDSTERSLFEPRFLFSDLSEGAEECLIDFGDGQNTSGCNVLHTYPDTGWYEYTQIVKNHHGCSDTLKGKIYVRPDFSFYVPNAFTPNRDELNDIFRPVTFGVKQYRLLIYDRWGQLIFETDNVKEGWDGTKNGKPFGQDVYVYMIDLTSVFDVTYHKVGRVTLVR